MHVAEVKALGARVQLEKTAVFVGGFDHALEVELVERLAAKVRAVPFGVEVMGRVHELGSLDDVVEICRRMDWLRPVLDFAHLKAHLPLWGGDAAGRAAHGSAGPI